MINSRIQPGFFYIEDNPAFCDIMNRVIKKEEVNLEPKIFNSGDAAINFLKDCKDPDCMPKFILLDLKMAGITGLDVLKFLRSQPLTKNTPVIMFTSSEMPEDVKKAYALGANAYIVKPEGYLELKDTVKSILAFWHNKNMLPS